MDSELDILGNRYLGLRFGPCVKSLKIHKNSLTISGNMDKNACHRHLLLFISKLHGGHEDAATGDNDTF